MFQHILKSIGRSPLRIEVTKKDEKALEEFLSGGVQAVRAVLRGLALRQLAKESALHTLPSSSL